MKKKKKQKKNSQLSSGKEELTSDIKRLPVPDTRIILLVVFIIALTIRFIYLYQVVQTPIFQGLSVDTEEYDKFALEIVKAPQLVPGPRRSPRPRRARSPIPVSRAGAALDRDAQRRAHAGAAARLQPGRQAHGRIRGETPHSPACWPRRPTRRRCP